MERNDQSAGSATTAKYLYIWRNRTVTSEATCLDDMINSLQSATDHFRDMRSAGVVLQYGAEIEDDYAYLETTDPAVAARFGFVPESEIYAMYVARSEGPVRDGYLALQRK